MRLSNKEKLREDELMRRVLYMRYGTESPDYGAPALLSCPTVSQLLKID